ncbi:Acetyltransferase (GNAT) family (modular protein) [uncultured Sporomusa sp.]|uniref:Acetyltransferase (GNAT) family (Modular protein) n=1 Tax=uncultured Sporomusa sp. TaxID=307249 RepID=A0A212M0K9_9FIRM|nr:GNAT family N-acetyltransferase [uncultured Sporomusa sp.]SCM83318.1 Acetyltransferase (GNAT) family (modular protein) [uncultured Sporomusa sp.]
MSTFEQLAVMNSDCPDGFAHSQYSTRFSHLHIMKSKYKEWTICKITANDTKSVLAFIIPMLHEIYPNIPDVAVRWDLANMEEAYTLDPKTALFAALNQDGKVVGTIAIRPYDDRFGKVKGCYDMTSTAELSRCYIDSSLRRQGIAGRLLAAMEDYCRSVGYSTICLHTHRFLPGGYPFWLSQQFIIRALGNDPLDTVYMDKSL